MVIAIAFSIIQQQYHVRNSSPDTRKGSATIRSIENRHEGLSDELLKGRALVEHTNNGVKKRVSLRIGQQPLELLNSRFIFITFLEVLI
jgi:hypothetical protein